MEEEPNFDDLEGYEDDISEQGTVTRQTCGHMAALTRRY